MDMDFVTSLLTALFMVSVVFLVLIFLWLLLRILGIIFLSREESKEARDYKESPEKQQV